MSGCIGSYKVHTYSSDNLRKILTERHSADREAVAGRKHLQYFEDYFSAMKALTIVEEYPYVDKDYLEDYSSYYVKCFASYDRWCTRLHFFCASFNKTEYAAYLEDTPSQVNDEYLQNAYLGFIVLKPLPVTVVGRTCLKTYPSESQREYPATRRYLVNLMGTCLSVQSLAFQEQDSVVAACATSALWSAFHKTGQVFQHAIPTPVEITKQATAQEPLEARSFPNHGLNGTQMARAIRNVELEPNLESAENAYMLATTAYAYLKAGIPSVIVFRLFDKANMQLFGRHAIAVSGYHLAHLNGNTFPGSNFLLRSAAVNKLYAHDDQIGPFSRVNLCDMVLPDEIKPGCVLDTSWGNDVVSVCDFLLIPVYTKIRVPYKSVHDLMLKFNEQFQRLLAGGGYTGNPFVWDIHLSTVQQLKQDWAHEAAISGAQRREQLVRNFPRYIWRASAYVDDTLQMDMLFDATDIEQGSFLNSVHVYDETLKDFMTQVAQQDAVCNIIKAEAGSQVLSLFRRFDSDC